MGLRLVDAAMGADDGERGREYLGAWHDEETRKGKPPPIRRGREGWLEATGADRADAVRDRGRVLQADAAHAAHAVLDAERLRLVEREAHRGGQALDRTGDVLELERHDLALFGQALAAALDGLLRVQ